MDLILKFSEPAIYGVQIAGGLYGVFLVILCLRVIYRKRFSSLKSADEFMTEVLGRLLRRDFEGVAGICNSPRYWERPRRN